MNPDSSSISSVRIRLRIRIVFRCRIWIQGFDDHKFKKVTAEKNLSFLSNFAVYLSLCLLKRHPSYRRSLQPTKGHVKKWIYFMSHFCPLGSRSGLRIRLRIQRPLNPDPIRIRIRFRIHNNGYYPVPIIHILPALILLRSSHTNGHYVLIWGHETPAWWWETTTKSTLPYVYN